MNDRELMQQALEALEFHVKNADEIEEIDLVLVTALRERLEQPEQEPVAWTVMNGVCNYQLFWSKHQADSLCAEMQKRHDLSGSLASFHVQPLYTAQPQRKPLTNDRVWLEYMQLWPFRPNEEPTLAKDILRFARAIEAAHGIGEKPNAA